MKKATIQFLSALLLVAACDSNDDATQPRDGMGEPTQDEMGDGDSDGDIDPHACIVEVSECYESAGEVCAQIEYETQDEAPQDDECSAANDACDLIADACLGPAGPASECELEHSECIATFGDSPDDLIACDVAYEACVDPDADADGSCEADQSVCDASLEICIAEIEAGIEDPAALTPDEVQALLEPCATEYESCMNIDPPEQGGDGMGEPEPGDEGGNSDQAICDVELDVCIAEIEASVDDPESLSPDEVQALLAPCAAQYEACLDN